MMRIGMIGAGWVTQHHLTGWQRQASRARVVAIADPSTGRAEERAAAFGITHVYASAEALLEAGGIDALDIAAPREAHAGLVRLAAARGLPALCQKPLAPTHAEAVALVDQVAGRMRLMVHENWRFRPCYRDIAEWLRAGRIGPVTQAQMRLLTSGFLPDAQGVLPALHRQPFLATLQRALVTEILIHHIDTLRFLLGEMTVVHAVLGKSSNGALGEDRAFVGFETARSTPVGLMANLCVHGEPGAKADELLLIGERGTVRLAGDRLVCEGEQPAERRYDLAACYTDSYAAAISHFVDALLAQTPFETDPRDNLHTLQLVEDIYRLGLR